MCTTVSLKMNSFILTLKSCLNLPVQLSHLEKQKLNTFLFFTTDIFQVQQNKIEGSFSFVCI